MNKPSEDIKDRLDIAELIQEYIPLKKAGANYKACCPFHNEKTPSLMVSVDKQIWHCFGCSKGGDIFAFVMEMEGLEFIDALKMLARKAGVQLRAPANPEQQSKRSKLLEILELTTEFFHQSLLKSKAGQAARDYLKTRQVSEESITNFKLGYSPNLWDALSNFLHQKGFQDRDILDAGLIIKRENKSGFYDRFRHRLMFPIADGQGNIVGFGGRIMPGPDEDQGAKYINSPQTMLYDKSRILYALDKAKSEMRRLDYAVIVEGYMDALASHQAGVKNVVASSGTALTLEQINLIKRYTSNVILAFDMDLAGNEAAKRGIDIALAQGLNVKVAIMPEGMDPDDCVRKNPKLWQKTLREAKAIMEFYFTTTFQDLDFSLVADKKKATAALIPVIANLTDEVEKAHYIQKLAQKLAVTEDILHDYLAKVKTQATFETGRGQAPEIEAPLKKNKNELFSTQLLSLAFNFPNSLEIIIPAIDEKHIHPSLQEVYAELKKYYTENRSEFQFTKFLEKLKSKNEKAAEQTAVVELYLQKDMLPEDFSSADVITETEQSIANLQKSWLQQQMKQLQTEIKQAEEVKNQSALEKLTEEFNKFSDQLAQIN
ncbi:DNA primase [Patescibacteria group bacterium]|nr:DNA primase [Patescibacteria group bacterium]